MSDGVSEVYGQQEAEPARGKEERLIELMLSAFCTNLRPDQGAYPPYSESLRALKLAGDSYANEAYPIEPFFGSAMR